MSSWIEPDLLVLLRFPSLTWPTHCVCICVCIHRAYLDVKELKDILKVDGSTHLNIFFANSTNEDLAGVATWPWDKEALTHLGNEVCFNLR